MFSYNPSSLNYSVGQAVQQGWTTPNLWKILVQGSSILLLSTIHRAYEMFSYDPCSLNYSVVWAVWLCWASLNSWKLSYHPCFFNYSVVEAVQGWMTLNSWKLPIQGSFILLLGGSSTSIGLNYPKLIKHSPMILVLSITLYFKQFGLVKVPQTYEKSPTIFVPWITR